jgi:hypothetical protein
MLLPIIISLAWSILTPAKAFVAHKLTGSYKLNKPITMSQTSLEKETLLKGKLQPAQFSTEELKQALNSLLEGSTNPSFDARHIFGYGELDHTLSTLQTITATVLLDYQAHMVR